MIKPTHALQSLLDVFEQPESACLLGAGVSYPLVPLVAQLGTEVRKRLLDVGSFPAIPTSQDDMARRILGPRRLIFDPCDNAGLLEEELVHEHLSPAAIRAAMVALLRPAPPSTVPVQYGVFNLAKHCLSLINFNNDGFAERFCIGHALVHPHGTSLSPADREHYEWEKHIDALQEFHGLRDIRIPGLLLPQKEPLDIARSQPYALTQEFLARAHRLAIIGYSFGAMDDWIAYRLVESASRRNGGSVVVVAPDAQVLATRLEYDSGNKSVKAFSARWKELSSAILISTKLPRLKHCTHDRLCTRCVAYLYECILDGGFRAEALNHRAAQIAMVLALRRSLKFDPLYNV